MSLQLSDAVRNAMLDAIESIDFLCDDPENLCDRDLLGV